MKYLSLILCLLLAACSPEPTAQARALPRITVTGRSMEPALHDGQTVALEQVAFEELKVGDIIVFCDPRQKPQKIIHRIFEVRRGYVWTKGDANARPDPFEVRAEQVVGRVK